MDKVVELSRINLKKKLLVRDLILVDLFPLYG